MKTYKLALVALTAVMLAGLWLVTPPKAIAELALTNVIYSWDYKVNKYQNSLVVVPWDGGWSPFIHKFTGEFNTTTFSTNTVAVDGTSIAITNTRWAGAMDYAVYHDDNSPMDAPGFRTTRRWSLVFCDRAKKNANDPIPPDGSFGGEDLDAPNPTEYYSNPTFFIEALHPIFMNQVIACSTGNCKDEMVTRLVVNLDKDSNGEIDATYRVGGVIGGAVRDICFYAEAQRPSQTTVTWGGNPQARVTGLNGGDKTVNFSPQPGGATAVTISSFDANTSSNSVIPISLVIPGALGLASAMAALGVWKLKRRS